MELQKIERLVDRLDAMRKFAKTMNELLRSGQTHVILQIQIPMTPEQVIEMAQNGGNIHGLMELTTPDGVRHIEKAAARLDVDVSDIEQVMVDLIEHCMDRARHLSTELKEEATK